VQRTITKLSQSTTPSVQFTSPYLGHQLDLYNNADFMPIVVAVHRVQTVGYFLVIRVAVGTTRGCLFSVVFVPKRIVEPGTFSCTAKKRVWWLTGVSLVCLDVG
jgi:hypothetical protein